MSAKHLNEHEEMVRLAHEILRLAQAFSNREAGRMAQLRLSFSRLVNRHCADEAKHFREGVRRGVLNPRVVEAFERELICWRADLASCNSEWPGHRIADDARGFHARFSQVTSALTDYIRRENTQMHAAI